MATNDSIFQSDNDENWYFWLGDGLKGPFFDYVQAHAELTKLLQENKNVEVRRNS